MKRKGEDFYSRSVTRVKVSPLFSDLAIKPREPLFFAGSCFAAALRDWWKTRFLPAHDFPFNPVYNPLSLKEGFDLLCSEKSIGKEELFFHQGLWRHHLYSPSAAKKDRAECLDRMNNNLNQSRAALAKSSFLILTLGTAFVYEEKNGGRVVNNCHKRPGTNFNRRSLSSREISRTLEETAALIGKINPAIRIILTLSPVRHLRDRAEENSLSKALLRCGMEDFLKAGNNRVYFPSYEILLDEMRDYRWYAEDLCHPSSEAVNYIMERFCTAAASPALRAYLKEAENLQKLLNHRILQSQSSETANFLETRQRKKTAFFQKYPFAKEYLPHIPIT